MRDDGERDRRGEDPHAIREGAGEEEHAGGGAPRSPTEASLQALVGCVLCAFEVAGQEQGGDADPADEVAEPDLEERQIAAGGDPRDRDHGHR